MFFTHRKASFLLSVGVDFYVEICVLLRRFPLPKASFFCAKAVAFSRQSAAGIAQFFLLLLYLKPCANLCIFTKKCASLGNAYLCNISHFLHFICAFSTKNRYAILFFIIRSRFVCENLQKGRFWQIIGYVNFIAMIGYLFPSGFDLE